MSRLKRMRGALALLAAFVAGCGWLGGDSALTSNDSLLRYVPADTPYVVAAVEPLPDAIADLFGQQTSLARNMIELGMQNALAELGNADLPGGQGPASGAPGEEALAILTELTSPEMFEASGINRDSTSVLYGFGLLPVLRVTLAEGHDFERVLDRLETLIELESNATIETGSVAGLEYRYITADQARFVIALLENELVATVVPTSFGDAELPSVLGLVLPEQSIADSGRLETIAEEYGFTASMVGLLDVERITSTFLDEPTATDAALLDLLGYDAELTNAVCRNEIRGLAGVAPLMVGGYTELNADTIATTFVVELREDIAEGLARIPTSVPGLGAVTDALLSFGMSFDIPAAREFVAARLDAIEADPFECEALAGIRELVPTIRIYLNQPLPPVVESFTGFSATMDFDDIVFASPSPAPTGMEFTVLIATDDAAGALAMASALDPEIAALDLRTDGQITELEMPGGLTGATLNPFGPTFFVATETEIGVGLGPSGEARLEELMRSPAGDPSTFLRISLDLAAYYGLLADTMGELALIDPDAPPPAAIASMAEMMRGLQAIYSRETADFRFTERGVEIPVRFDLVP